MTTDALDRYDDDVRPPSGLSAFLYPRPAERTAGGIFRWWESRRIGFNLVVGASGVLTLGAAWMFSVLPPHAPGISLAWQPIVAYGVLANVCYSLGPAIEMLMNRLFGGDVLPVGPVMWRMGLTFSVGLTLGLPLILMTIAYLARIVFGG